MKCPIESQENSSLLLDYCARKIDPASAAVLERHIKACPACQEFQSAQQSLWSALDRWQPLPVSSDFDRRLYAVIDAEAVAPWWSRLTPVLRSHWKPAVSLAAVCLALIAVSLFQAPSTAPAPVEPASPVRIEMVQMDQMERALEDLEMLRQFDLTAANESNSGSL